MDGRLQVADWGHLPLAVLEGLKCALEGTKGSSSCSTTLLKSARLVNRHWCNWATVSVKFLKLQDCFTDLDVLDENPLPWIADTIKNKFAAVQGLCLLDYHKNGRVDVGALEGLHQLTQLDLRYHVVYDSDLEHLKCLTALTHLSISGYRHEYGDYDLLVSEKGLAHVGKLTGLKHLVLDSCLEWEFEDRGMRHLTGLTCLEHLQMRDCPCLTDACVEWVGMLTTLTHLDMSSDYYDESWDKSNRLTDQGLKHVAQLSALKHLSLGGSDVISDKGLRCIGKLTDLDFLDLSNMDCITADGLNHLKQLHSLTSLILDGCLGISDAVKERAIEGVGLASTQLDG